MPRPVAHEEPADEPVFTAADMLAFRRRQGQAPVFDPPRGVILCYQSSALRYAARKYGGKKVSGFYGELYLLKKAGQRIGVLGNFGLGGPVVAVLLEELAAFGTRRFISVGLAGALQASAKAGDLVIATQAIPDDGVSPHYLAESPGAVRSTGLADGLAQSLEAAGHRYQLGTCWSTSAPYREGRRQLARHQAEGAVAVDMEAAALYAVAGRLNILACAALVISDSLADGNWEPSPNSRDQEQGLRRLVDAAILAMAG